MQWLKMTYQGLKNMPSIVKFEFKKFDRSNDFGLWRVKMRCLLIQPDRGYARSIPKNHDRAKKIVALKTDVYKKAHSALLLCLDNKVLREVNKQDYAARVWLKLENLYMTKTLANKFYLKKKLFTFHMHLGKKLSEHIDEFYKLIGDFANIDIDIDNEDQELILNSWESKKTIDANDDGDGLYVRGRSDHQDNQGRGSLRSKSKGKGTYKQKCYIGYSEDHLKKNCPKRNKKKSTGFVKNNAGQGSVMHFEGYDNGDLLMVVSEERFLEWIMNSGGSYHMMAMRDFLFHFKEFSGGMVLLDDNKACAIIGTRKMRVQMKDGSSFVLENNERVKVIKGSLMLLSITMKQNCVYSLDGWAKSGTLDQEGYTVKLQNGRVKVIKGLHELERRDVMGNKGLGKLELCGNCVHGKSTRVSFGRGQHTTEGVIDYVHADLWDPSRSGFPDSFLAEAIVMAAYLINRSPSTSLGKKKPMDLWSGHLMNYEMLRIFGCVAYSNVNQGKLNPRAIKCIFLGYPDGGVGAADSRKEVEFKVELQGSRVEPTVDPHTGENPGNKDEEQDEGPQQHNLDNYVLVRDRAKRTINIHARYRDEGNVSLSRPSWSRVEDNMRDYAFPITEEEDTHEPIIF
ncbi:hypothetical protein Tco_0236459 [Tanacetum coccineum]